MQIPINISIDDPSLSLSQNSNLSGLALASLPRVRIDSHLTNSSRTMFPSLAFPYTISHVPLNEIKIIKQTYEHSKILQWRRRCWSCIIHFLNGRERRETLLCFEGLRLCHGSKNLLGLVRLSMARLPPLPISFLIGSLIVSLLVSSAYYWIIVTSFLKFDPGFLGCRQ
jgi:hypothetical protein